MAPLTKEIEIPVPWGKLRGKWWGPLDKQPILFLHGWQDNSGSFDTLIPLLSDSLSILCIDFPGHGLSSKIPPGQFNYAYWDGVIIVRRIVKHFGWSKISIGGHSLGGAVGFIYAATFPEEIEKLICFDVACPRFIKPTTIIDSVAGNIDNFLKYETLALDKQPTYSFEEMVEIAQIGYGKSVTKESVELLLHRGMKPLNGCPGKFTFTRDLRLKVSITMGVPSLDEILLMADRICCDYLNLQAYDSITRTSYASDIYPTILEHLKKSCRSFKHYVVDGKHHVHLNEPEKISNMLNEFLCNENSISNNGTV